jgi:hypothetical protein
VNIIPGYPNYLATEDGRVFSIKRQIFLKPTLTGSGYLKVNLSGKQLQLHRVIASAFLGPVPEGKEVLHLNHTPLDCGVANLKYGTHSENLLMRRPWAGTHCKNGHERAKHSGKQGPDGRYVFCKRCHADRQNARDRAARENQVSGTEAPNRIS